MKMGLYCFLNETNTLIHLNSMEESKQYFM